mgnify:CR=1 FL=1
MKFFLLIVSLLFTGLISAQTYSLQGKISGLQHETIKISNFYGNEDRVIDSVLTDNSGAFTYHFPEDFQTGMYRLRFLQNQFMDIIYNQENISFTSDLTALIDSLEFITSLENQLYFEYLNKRNMMEYKMELLGPVKSYYPQGDPFYDVVYDQFESINNAFKEFVDELIAENKNTLVSRIVKSDYMPSPPLDMDQMQAMQYMRDHFFDNVDFSDTTLLYTNIFSGKVMQYLSFYQNNRMTKDQLQVEFIKAVNKIMDVTSVNQEVYQYVLDYLITGFESYGFEKVITYIADNISFDETCVNSERKAQLEKKVESLKKFSVGNKAPDFSTTDLSGNGFTLSESGSQYTLLVFWATWCPHCTNLIPQLQSIYFPEISDKLEIGAVSLDDSKDDLRSFLDEGEYGWVNICDFNKWKGNVVQKYDVYATPTMYLLFQDQTILAKPMTFDALKTELFERNILH